MQHEHDRNAAHDAWFRAQVKMALADPRPAICREMARQRMAAQRARLLAMAAQRADPRPDPAH